MMKKLSLNKAILGAGGAVILLMVILGGVVIKQRDEAREQLTTAKASIEFLAQQAEAEKARKLEVQTKLNMILQERTLANKNAKLLEASIKETLNEMANSCNLNPALHGVFLESYKGAGSG
jgi:hypothetical protein